jgi:hypothetical protein
VNEQANERIPRKVAADLSSRENDAAITVTAAAVKTAAEGTDVGKVSPPEGSKCVVNFSP